MTILEALVKLRDDLKLWCINNFNNKLNKNLGSEKSGRFLTVNESGDIVTTDVPATPDELEYLSGVTSNVQEQLDGKAASGHTHSYAGSSSAGGAATSANKLNTNAGSATQPVYFENGIPVATTHTLDKSVPNDAVFTDTTYNEATKDTAGLLSAANKIQLDYGGAPIVTTAGTGAAYTATVNGMTELTQGMSFVMIPHTISTSTAPTLNVNGLGAKTIRRRVSNATNTTAAGYNVSWLSANKPIRVEYDGTFWIADLPKPSAADMSGTLTVKNGGTGYASIVDTTYTTARYRASALVDTETNPSDNGVINWTYE